MTPTEALKVAMDAQDVDDDVDPSKLIYALGLLGFVVVPVEPAEERVEAMAMELRQSSWLARRAYAAAIGETRRD